MGRAQQTKASSSKAKKTIQKKAMPKKSSKKAPVSPVDEVSEADATRLRRAQTRRSRKAKLVGYRQLAKDVGYMGVEDGVLASNADSTHALLSIADAKRLCAFVPCTPGATTFTTAEFERRHGLFQKGVPRSAARETQARADVVLRNIMNEVVLRASEAGKTGVTASMMLSVLRPYQSRMMFTAVQPPLGLIRHAQDNGVLTSTEADEKLRAEEKAAAATHKKMHEQFLKSEQDRKDAKREAKAAKEAA
jgi:hypothetical protein